MLEAIRQPGALQRTRDTCATGRVVVIPKNSEKRNMIFNCRAQNHADPRKPKGFKLPQIERIWEKLLFSEVKEWWWMCKLELSNCFWSIRLPALWRHFFKVFVRGGGGQMDQAPIWVGLFPCSLSETSLPDCAWGLVQAGV